MALDKGLLIKNDPRFIDMVDRIDLFMRNRLQLTKTYTPILESVDIERKSGVEIKSQMFKVMKRGDGDGYDHILRYDQTCGLPALINGLNLSFKKIERYQIGSVFRGERRQDGRYSEFMQADVDIIGGDERIGMMTILTYLALTLGEIKINPKYKYKIHTKGFDSDSLRPAMALCENIGILMVEDEHLDRGHGYYSGPMFEVFVVRAKDGVYEKNAVAGGGAYNNYIRDSHSAIGFSIGLERIFEYVDKSLFERSRLDYRAVIIDHKSRYQDAMDIYFRVISDGKRTGGISIYKSNELSHQDVMWYMSKAVILYDKRNRLVDSATVKDGRIIPGKASNPHFLDETSLVRDGHIDDILSFLE